jgi:uncharacterized protein YtpQ (UPF0354 family)
MSGFRALLLLALLCAGLAGPSAAQVMSRRAFTQEFAAAVRAEGMSATIKADLELAVKDGSGISLTMFLDNAYAQYSANPQARAEVMQRYIGSLLDSRAAAAPVDRARIVPVVKDRGWLRALPGSGKRPQHVFEDLNEDLVVVYAEDSPKSIRYLAAKDLEQLGLRREELRPLAVGNLEKLLPDIQLRRGELVSMLTAGGNYEASLLLLDAIWSGGQLQVDGEIVVAVPARDLLLFTGSRHKAGVARLREIAVRAAREESYSLTGRLFVYRNGKFQRFH